MSRDIYSHKHTDTKMHKIVEFSTLYAWCLLFFMVSNIYHKTACLLVCVKAVASHLYIAAKYRETKKKKDSSYGSLFQVQELLVHFFLPILRHMEFIDSSLKKTSSLFSKECMFSSGEHFCYKTGLDHVQRMQKMATLL
jgi:hypothetical protein